MSNERQINYVNEIQNRAQNLYYVDDASELNSIDLKENDKIYAINDNKLFQMEIADQDEELSGSIVSFNGRNNTKIKSVVTNIEPIQDLHGYENPWPAGVGVNIFDYDNPVLVTVEYGGSAKDRYGHSYTNAGSYAINAYNPSYMYFGAIVKYADNTWSPINYVVSNGASSTPKLINISSGDTLYVIDIQPESQEESVEKLNRNKVQVAFSNTQPTEWSPYSNICPISGHTGLTVARTGKNLFDQSATTAIIDCYDIDGAILKRRAYTIELPPGTYTFSATKKPNISGGAFIYLNKVNADGSLVSFYYFIVSPNTSATYTQTLTDGQYFLLYDAQAADASATNKFDYFDIQLELGSTASAFEPYNGTTIPIIWQSEVGTVYGGSVEVIGGSLESTMGMVDLGTLDWTRSTNSIFIANSPDNSFNTRYFGNDALPFICSSYKGYFTHPRSGEITMNSRNTGVSKVIRVSDPRFQDAESFKAAVSGVQLCYELAELVEYTLTGNEMNTFYGQNNIWSDIGDITVKIAEKGITAFELNPYN